ncbi:MAG: hypothetical protein ACK52C_11555 [Planctomycetia bacterium]
MRVSFLTAVLLFGAVAAVRAEEPLLDPPPSDTAPTREVAADGTVSVVVAPPTQTPPAQPAALPQPPAEPPAQAPADPSAALLERAAAPPAPSSPEALASRPLPLVEALVRSGDRSRRLWIAQAYWKVSAVFGQVHFAAAAVERLEMVAPGAAPHDRAVLDAATAAARAELATARAELAAAQQELLDLVRLPIGEPLPWPVDRPLTMPYQTHFDAIFAARPATGRTRAINRMLPSRHEALAQSAVAATAAEEAFRMAEADHAKGERPIEAVVAAHETLVAREREFARACKAYNCDIAEYVMAVADLSLPDDQFAAMLIGRPTPWQPLAPVQPAGLVAPAVSASAQPVPPSNAPPAGFVPIVPAPVAPVAAP